MNAGGDLLSIQMACGLIGCLRRSRSDCFWHGWGGSVHCGLGVFPLTLVLSYTAFMSGLSRQFEIIVNLQFYFCTRLSHLMASFVPTVCKICTSTTSSAVAKNSNTTLKR